MFSSYRIVLGLALNLGHSRSLTLQPYNPARRPLSCVFAL